MFDRAKQKRAVTHGIILGKIKQKLIAREKEKISHILIKAAQRNDLARVAEIVEKYGSDGEIINHAHVTRMLFDEGPPKLGATALDRAVQNNNLEMVKVLLRAPGIDVNTRSCYWPPIYMAAVNRNAEMLQAIAEAPTARAGFTIQNEMPLVSAAIYYSCESALPAILNIPDVTVNQRDDITDKRWAALHYALYSENTFAFECLLRVPEVDLNIINSSMSETPLCLAARKGNTAAVSALLKKGANPKIVDGNFDLPLVIAYREGHMDIVKILAPITGPVSITPSREDNRRMKLGAIMSRLSE